MGKQWSVDVLQSCKMCGGKLPNARFRSYCSLKCRQKRNNQKQQESGYNTAWQRNRREKIASVPSPDKCQCIICGKFYVQVGTHIWAVHKMTCREYREHFELEVKKGVVPEWYRKLKGDQAIDNETYLNLKKGVKYRFKKGSKTAGRYKRSPITIERLRNNNSYKKKLNTVYPPCKGGDS